MSFGICSFISEESLKLHNEYLETLKNRYSVVEKGNSRIKNKSLSDIMKMRLTNKDKTEILELRSEIIAHELFFNSFAEPYKASKCVRHSHRSEASFLYELYEKAKHCDSGFLLIYKEREHVKCYVGREYCEVILRNTPLLALDLYEHAYFYDYGFNKDRYIERALSVLDLGKLN